MSWEGRHAFMSVVKTKYFWSNITGKMITCPNCRSNDIRVYKETRNGVIYKVYICNQCGCAFGAGQELCFVYLQTYWTNKNDQLYNGSSSSNIDWLHRLWKRWSCFRLDRKNIYWLHYYYFLNALMKRHISCQRLD